MLSEKEYIKLAKAVKKQHDYENELYSKIVETANKYGVCKDFLGFTNETGDLTSTCCDILGNEFSYFLYDCEGSFKGYNERVTLADGSHPNIKNFKDLYDLEKEFYES